MKRSVFIIIIGIVVCAICFYYQWVSIRGFVSSSIKLQTKRIEVDQYEAKVRESITFILGEDKEEDNRYYQEATHYYTNNIQGRTDYLVPGCRSLLEVRNYLEKNKPCNGLPWGLVNLVSHGNQWTGLSVKITPDSKRTTAARIEESINNKTFEPLPVTIVDKETEIFLHGCGIGNNHRLVNAIASAFGDCENKPVVRASRLFEYYASVKFNNVIQSERYMANTWFVSYKMGEKPGINLLVNELREKYPDATVDWREALLRRKPRRVGDVYHYTFEVPVKWIIPVHNDSLPDLASKKSQLTWLQMQKQIVDDLAELAIAFEKFNWTLTKVYTNNSDGSKSPAIWVKGYCTMLTVLQVLTESNNESLALQKPFTPNLNDNRYYYSSVHSYAIAVPAR